MWRVLQIVFAVLNLGLVVLVVFWILKSPATALSSPSLEYKDFVSILLTAIGVMIAVLTIFLAVVALWGYAQLKEEARRVADDVAREVGKQSAEEVAREVGKQSAVEVATFEARRAAEEFLAKENRGGGGDYGAAAGASDGGTKA